ncbi:MAG TPA: hypothetical protein VLS89_17555 [Candidatus Nanopelagicales bacterium]|nr:hypothetical protein [Candidatus Nanopelagicales bacterium]
MTAADPLRFEGLPRPELGKMTIYVFGPGVGESQVVALPDGRWIVVDTCEHDNVVLPRALLDHFEVRTVDLLIVSHPDRDHYKGLPRLLAGPEEGQPQPLDVKLLWRYRGSHARRHVLAKLCADDPSNQGRFAELREAEKAMERLGRGTTQCEAALETEQWPSRAGANYEVTCIAPCQADQTYETEQWVKLFKLSKNGLQLDDRVERFLRGKARGLDGKGNPLSLAIVIRWGSVGVLLGGDVEASSDVDRGWNGVLAALAKDWPKNLDLLRDLHVVKVSHHGSKGAFSEAAWRLHAEARPVDLAIVTPYQGGSNPPPHRETFRGLARFAARVALTSEPSAWGKVTDAGWVRINAPTGPGKAACVALTLDGTSPPEVWTSEQGAVFAPLLL